MAVLASTLVPGIASAQCAAWEIPGHFGIFQSNGVEVLIDDAERRGNLFVARATYYWSRQETYMGDFFMPDRRVEHGSIHGQVDGVIEGDAIRFTVYWQIAGNVIGYYRGTIADDGTVAASDHWIYQRGNEHFTWRLAWKLQCRRVSPLFRTPPPPTRSEREATDPGDVSDYDPYDPRGPDSVRLPPQYDETPYDPPRRVDPDRVDPGPVRRSSPIDPDRVDPGPISRPSPIDPDRVDPGPVRRPPRIDPDRVDPGPVVRPRRPSPGDMTREPGGFDGALGECIEGFVWREARPGDRVCVTPRVRENARAHRRVDPSGAYGPQSCEAGFVWREAFDGDTVCVRPEIRAQTLEDNRLAASRRRQ